jgi:hypothetical protein
VYFTEHPLAFKRELQHTGKWTIEKVIALAKLFFTGVGRPKTALLLQVSTCGGNTVLDFLKHPEIPIISKLNPSAGVLPASTPYSVTSTSAVPNLDTLGCLTVGTDGEDALFTTLILRSMSFSTRVDGEEATRKGMEYGCLF